MTTIHTQLDAFQPISLNEMENVALLDRMDTKYVLKESQLHEVLQRLIHDYRVFEINHTRLNHYRTLYFDTPDFDLYHRHHNGAGTRYKVRAREYVGSNLSFFEVKHKTNQKRTIKSRIQIPHVTMHITDPADSLIHDHTPFNGDELEPKLWNEYHRITLVGCEERVTLDLNVSFCWQDSSAVFPGVVIAEVKQGHFSKSSPFIQQMRHMGIRPESFSKYTAGVYSLYNHVKINNFKQQINHVHKLIQEETCSKSG